METSNSNKSQESKKDATIEAANISANATIRAAKIGLMSAIVAALIAAVVYLYVDHKNSDNEEENGSQAEIKTDKNSSSDSSVLKKTPDKKIIIQPIREPKGNSYIAVERTNNPNKQDVAILLVGKTQQESSITAAIASKLKAKGNDVAINLFNNRFKKEVFPTIFGGGGVPIHAGEFKKYVDKIVLGKLSFSDYVNDREMHDVRLDLELNIYDATNLNLLDSKQLHGSALEFRLDNSTRLAKRKLIEQINQSL